VEGRGIPEGVKDKEKVKALLKTLGSGAKQKSSAVGETRILAGSRKIDL